MNKENIVARIEGYIADYVSLIDERYSLPIALWIMGTFCFNSFDAFPYLVITSSTKRSGKTRLSEIISCCCSKPRSVASLTAATLFSLVDQEEPTLINDEAESLSSETADSMRAILNVGYRKGQTVTRMWARNVSEFKTYCPKVFILIGDVNDTLRDRSIIIRMRRAPIDASLKRFTFDAARFEGQELREEIQSIVKNHAAEIRDQFAGHGGLPFLNDRDEEIWTSLFCIARVFCPNRIEELNSIATDLCTEKTEEAFRYVDLGEENLLADEDEYGRRLLIDLYGLVSGTNGNVIPSQQAIDMLKAIPTAPWRKFRGAGLTVHDLGNMLSRFGVKSRKIQIGKGRKERKLLQGYKREDIEKGMERL